MESLAISPFFIVRDVPSALVFYRDRLGFEVDRVLEECGAKQ